MYYWIIQNKREFLRRASGSTFLEISKKEIEKIIILRPAITEQIKISQLLASVDEKIAQVSSLVTSAKTFKKGLLQQMFV